MLRPFPLNMTQKILGYVSINETLELISSKNIQYKRFVKHDQV